MSNTMPKTQDEILATYGEVKQSAYGSRWYFANDYGKAMSGTYYRQQAVGVMLNDVKNRMRRMVQRLENRSKSYVVKYAGT